MHMFQKLGPCALGAALLATVVSACSDTATAAAAAATTGAASAALNLDLIAPPQVVG